MNLAEYMVAVTALVFALGAGVALAWSLASGQWRDLPSAARSVLDDTAPDGAPAKEA